MLTAKRIIGALRRQRRHIFDQKGIRQYDRTPLYDRRLPLIVLWSQKAASTTVLKWYFEKLGLLDEALRYHRFAHAYETEIFKKTRNYTREVNAALCDPATPVVKFVRDPAARAFSGYLYLCSRLNPRTADAQPYYWRWRVIRFVHGASGKFDSAFSFIDYLEWLATEAPLKLDGHLAPQYTEIEAQLSDRLTLCKVEELPTAFAALEQRLSLKPVDPKRTELIMTSRHHYRKDAASDVFERALTKGLKAPKRPSAPMPDVTTKMLDRYPDAKTLVQKCFAQDYRAYGYS